MSVQKLSNYINGKFVAPESGSYIDNINPSTDKIQNYVPNSDERDVEKAINAARKAYPAWRDLHFSERAVYLRKIGAEMSKPDVIKSLATADTNDMARVFRSFFVCVVFNFVAFGVWCAMFAPLFCLLVVQRTIIY